MLHLVLGNCRWHGICQNSDTVSCHFKDLSADDLDFLANSEMGLSKKLPDMSEDEQIKLLSTDGMLVKRPLLVADDFVLTGFKEDEWKGKLLEVQC